VDWERKAVSIPSTEYLGAGSNSGGETAKALLRYDCMNAVLQIRIVLYHLERGKVYGGIQYGIGMFSWREEGWHRSVARQ
jgi:hypothetical protein